jgi:hypothetical protein
MFNKMVLVLRVNILQETLGLSKAKAIAATKAGLCKFGGFVFFSLGFAGIFLPLLPTTIFWIMAVWLFSKTHPEMMVKIYEWPKVGTIVQSFAEQGIVKPRSKKTATYGIIGVGGLSIWVAGLSLGWALGLMGLFAAIILYIWSCPSQ